jgi:hypothetical protein
MIGQMWFCLCAFIAVVLAQEHQQTANATDIPKACGMEFIWPPSDGIVLFATDSRESLIYVKFWGDCSEFLRRHNNSYDIHFHFLMLVYDRTHGDRNTATFTLGVAAPLVHDRTPVHYRAMRSPLLVSSNRDNFQYDITGHDASKEYSLWCFTLIYPHFMVNIFGVNHDFDTHDREEFVLEAHLLSNSSTPASSVPVSPNTLTIRALGKPTSHFYAVSPRYTT